MRTGKFFQSSQSIVKGFLSNVVAIDDMLCFGNMVANVHQEQSMEIEDNFDHSEDDSGLGVVNISPASEVQLKIGLGEAHSLDYQDLSLAFSEHGINCSGFIPDKNRAGFSSVEEAATKIMKSARRADVTILDWNMDAKFGADTGTLAKACLQKIIQHDKMQHGRLRLIVIYTAEPDHKSIAEAIKDYLNAVDKSILANQNDKCIDFESTDLAFCKIVVIEKKVTAIELCEEVVELFTELTIGLLPNATLSALGELRDKTHHILHAFNKDLDPAYLSHVLGLLSSPKVRENADEVALDYAAELISEEFKSMVQISQPFKKSLEKTRIKDWLDHINSKNDNEFFEIIVGEESGKVGTAKIKELLDATKSREIKAILNKEPKIIKDNQGGGELDFFERSRIQVNLHNGSTDSHEKLSIIECKRRGGLSLSYQNYDPNIKLGSIIKSVDDDAYYICLQPLCDSVRLSNDTEFLFLKVSTVTKPKGKFSHVIQSKTGDNIRLMIRPTSKNIQTFSLKWHSKSRTVKAVKSEGDDDYLVQYTGSKGGDGHFIWIGELKNSVAQCISNKVAASISRIGIDTNEWLRLSASVADD